MSYIDAIKLLGILNLTPTQLEYLRLAHVLRMANGSIDARGRRNAAFKAAMRRLVKFTLAVERFPGVFDLTSTGRELGDVLETRRVASSRLRPSSPRTTT